MPVKSSGTFLKFSEIATEFGDTQPYSMSEYIRGGSLVPDAAANGNVRSQAQRTAGGVNGRMKFSDYYGASNVFGLEIASNATDVNLATLFTAADATVWASSLPKILTINSGVIVGATSTSNAALIIPSGMGGTLTIVNNGDIQGAGGAGGTAGNAGGNGGDAISAASAVTITNNGNIYAGGGGGGAGGNGGAGANYSYTYQQSYGGVTGHSMPCSSRCYDILRVSGIYCAAGACRTFCYYSCSYECTNCVRDVSTTAYGTSDGAGGTGAAGRGYNQSIGTAGSGSNATAASNGAGTGGQGGSGGAGGDWGTAGVSGDQGNQGGNNNGGVAGSAGAAGLAGGAAGRYINGNSFVTWDVLGTVAGGTN